MQQEDTIIVAGELQTYLSFDLEPSVTYEQLLKSLSEKVNAMINEDFSGLVQLLYRMDISEKKLKEVLNISSLPSGELIAEMMIERQLQKIETRKHFKAQPDIPEDEKW